MTLKSAFEDLVGTTLAALSGTLTRLEYLASLRRREAHSYSHWGLARVYGERAAQQALTEAHRTVFLKMLRTSLRQLHEDVAVGGNESVSPVQSHLEELRERQSELLPEDLGGGSAVHFSSVLRALSSLEKHPPRATPQA